MKRNALRRRKWNYTALSFLLPVCGLLIVRIICSIFFNGTYSLFYSDCYHQYYPFFLEFRRALRSGESLLYNWSVGMGMDYLGLISYYLASPLNLFSALLPESFMVGYFSLLMPIKLGFAGMFFAIFLKKTFRKMTSPLLSSVLCMRYVHGHWDTSGTSCGWIHLHYCHLWRWAH